MALIIKTILVYIVFRSKRKKICIGIHIRHIAICIPELFMYLYRCSAHLYTLYDITSDQHKIFWSKARGNRIRPKKSYIKFLSESLCAWKWICMTFLRIRRYWQTTLLETYTNIDLPSWWGLEIMQVLSGVFTFCSQSMFRISNKQFPILNDVCGHMFLSHHSLPIQTRQRFSSKDILRFSGLCSRRSERILDRTQQGFLSFVDNTYTIVYECMILDFRNHPCPGRIKSSL